MKPPPMWSSLARMAILSMLVALGVMVSQTQGALAGELYACHGPVSCMHGPGAIYSIGRIQTLPVSVICGVLGCIRVREGSTSSHGER